MLPAIKVFQEGCTGHYNRCTGHNRRIFLTYTDTKNAETFFGERIRLLEINFDAAKMKTIFEMCKKRGDVFL
jgi:hypothetical protein